MKSIVLLAFALGAVAPVLAQPNVGVSIGINQPGVYGRINIGDVPRPALYRAEPVMIQPARVVVERQPVYFVRDEWVRERYAHEHPDWNRGRHRGWDKHDDRRGDDGGRGHGNKHRD